MLGGFTEPIVFMVFRDGLELFKKERRLA